MLRCSKWFYIEATIGSNHSEFYYSLGAINPKVCFDTTDHRPYGPMQTGRILRKRDEVALESLRVERGQVGFLPAHVRLSVVGSRVRTWP